MVVDDEDTIRTVLSELLKEEGHEVVDVPSGEAALETFMEKPFPLVITDIVMVGMTGVEVLEEIKKIDSDTQVIIMTSHASMDTSIKALTQHASQIDGRGDEETGKFMREWRRKRGEGKGIQYAESFKRIIFQRRT